jgi:hypothetical protein
MKERWICFCFLGCFAAAYGLVFDSPSEYIVQTYAQYTRPDSGQAKYAEFDASGNLYITHDGGSLVRIDANKQAAVLGRYRNLQGIFFGEGTNYGSLLYFNDADAGHLYARQADGTTAIFTTFSGKPIGLTVDKSGLYGGNLFVPVRYSHGDLYQILPNGQKTSVLQLGLGWSGHDIESDSSGVYGGRLFMSVTDPQNNSSVYVVNPDWTVSVFCSLTWILDIEFDTTQGGAFGGLLYGCRSDWAIGSISPEGQWTRFAGSENINESIKCLTFGPDRSMYVVEELPGAQIVVLKISAVPEPMSLCLLAVGIAVLRRKEDK